jgi:hypothetical protein
MRAITLLVLANPNEPQLAMLEQLPDSASIAVGNNVEAFERAAPVAQALFNWSGPRALVEKVWKIAPHVEWVHSRAAGLDGLLFPALIESPALQSIARRIRCRLGALLRQGFPAHDP